MIQSLVSDLEAVGYQPKQIVLFGSYAKGRPHTHSDVDVAIWDDRFTGCGTADIAPIASIVSRYPRLELHTFGPDDTTDNNPFVGEVLKYGIPIKRPEPTLKTR